MAREIELLSPAASPEVGRVALSAGADAIYIGAPKFGARSSAGVSLPDIAQLTYEAHSVGAKVYVALNTVLKGAEVLQATDIIRQLYLAGVDAVIVQDMGLLLQELPPMPLHASTQCHNNSRGQLLLMEELGMEQVVLPRELSCSDVAGMVEGLSVRVESFVHGALCVSYSGRCFISEACQGRSANRGACAQYCRMSYDLEDASGNKLVTSEHLLSLRDLNRSELIGAMVRSGVSSFKIEGRLKGSEYVRNVTAHYRQLIDAFIAESGGLFVRASWGSEAFQFTPRPELSFSRRFTGYNTPLHKPIPTDSITRFTNKSVGEEVGRVIGGQGREPVVALVSDAVALTNGDGLLFVTDEKSTDGAQVNQVTPLGGDTYRIKLSSKVSASKGAIIYRNLNHQFTRQLLRPDASVRKVPIDILCRATPTGIELEATIAQRPEVRAKVQRSIALEPAKRDNSEHLLTTLAKLGNTPYSANDIRVEVGGLYLPLSVVAELRRELIEALQMECNAFAIRERDKRGVALQQRRERFLVKKQEPSRFELPDNLPFTYNVANRWAEELYRKLGVKGSIEPAMEVTLPTGEVPVMYCRHCLLHRLGYCTREGRKPPFPLPLYLVRGRERFRVSTDCTACVMTLWKAPTP